MKEIKPGYKETPIGILPRDWEVKSLGEVTTIIMGQSPSSEYYNSENIGIPLIQGNADFNKRKIKNRIFTEQITKLCEKGDIIMTVRAPVGAIALSEISACIGRGVCAIKFDSLFLYHYLVYSENKWEKISQGSTFTAVNSGDIKNFLIPIPPKEDQEKIAQILMTWDEAIEKQEELIEQEKEFKKGMMQKIFSQKLRFKDENGNDYPEWEEKRLGSLTNLEHGDGDWILSEDISLDGVFKIIQLGNVGFGKYIEKNLKTISQEKFKKINGTLLEKGDLLINRMVDENINVCILNKDGNFITSVDVCWIRRNQYFDNRFFKYILLTESSQKKLLSLSSGSGRVRISKKNLFEKFVFLLPSLSEQEKIADFLSTIDEKIDVLEKKLEELKEQKKGLMQKLLTGEVRVKS